MIFMKITFHFWHVKNKTDYRQMLRYEEITKNHQVPCKLEKHQSRIQLYVDFDRSDHTARENVLNAEASSTLRVLFLPPSRSLNHFSIFPSFRALRLLLLMTSLFWRYCCIMYISTSARVIDDVITDDVFVVRPSLLIIVLSPVEDE